MEGLDLEAIEKLKKKICKQIEKEVDKNDPDLAYKYATLLEYLK